MSPAGTVFEPEEGRREQQTEPRSSVESLSQIHLQVNLALPVLQKTFSPGILWKETEVVLVRTLHCECAYSFFPLNEVLRTLSNVVSVAQGALEVERNCTAQFSVSVAGMFGHPA